MQYGAAFCGVLAAGAAVAPLPPSSTAASLTMMLKDSGRQTPPARPRNGRSAGKRQPRRDRAARCARRQRCRRAFLGMARPGRRDACQSRDRPRTAVQRHLFVRHDRRAQGNCPAARLALGAVQAARLQERRDGRLDAALFEYDSRRLPSDAGAWEHRRAVAQIRRRGNSSASRKSDRATHAMLVPVQYRAASWRAEDFGRYDLSSLRTEALHQRAVPRRAEGRRPRTLAGRSRRNITVMTEGGGADDARRPSSFRTSCTPSASRWRATTFG